MKNSYLILITFMLLIFSASVRAVDVHINRECDENSSAHAINDCSMVKLKEADNEMNRLYKEKVSVIKTTKNKDRFRDAQRAWITFRDKVCLYEAGLSEESGSVYPFQSNGCLEFYTKRRIEDLKYYISCNTDDCPN